MFLKRYFVEGLAHDSYLFGAAGEATVVDPQRDVDDYLADAERAEFARRMTADLPDRPAYFAHAVQVNLTGARPWSDLAAPRKLSEDALTRAAAADATVIDTRPAALFGAGHFPGSLNFGRARIGFDEVVGYCEAETLTRTQQLSQLSAENLKAGLGRGDALRVLDVRALAEWQQSCIQGALHMPLPALAQRMGELPKSRPLAVICASGYRSSIAASLLQARGFGGLQNVMGGMAAYAAADETT
jgi:rhodanese-related sulfurtransferase